MNKVNAINIKVVVTSLQALVQQETSIRMSSINIQVGDFEETVKLEDCISLALHDIQKIIDGSE